jgi:hypothetical protein
MIIDIKDPPPLALSKNFLKKTCSPLNLEIHREDSLIQSFTTSASLVLQGRFELTQNSSLDPIRTSEYLKGLA